MQQLDLDFPTMDSKCRISQECKENGLAVSEVVERGFRIRNWNILEREIALSLRCVQLTAHWPETQPGERVLGTKTPLTHRECCDLIVVP